MGIIPIIIGTLLLGQGLIKDSGGMALGGLFLMAAGIIVNVWFHHEEGIREWWVRHYF